MKKLLIALAVGTMAVACTEIEELDSSSKFIVTGYNQTDDGSRTAFGTPNEKTIPFLWSAGDYIWLGANKSETISSECQIAQFEFKESPATVGQGHIFYNLTGESDAANVLATQTADGNLGNDGDFGYATLDKYNSFCLKHKTSFLWFDTTTEDEGMPKLSSIKVDANGVNIAGKQTYDFQNDQWDTNVTEGSSSITLNFANGHTLLSSNDGVMAAMVCLPAAVSGKTLTITYSFDDGSIFTETKNPNSDFVAGATLRVKTSIAKKDLVKEPSYELRVLTFEDEDVKFEPYELEYGEYWEIRKWSDLIDKQQQDGDLLYDASYCTPYTWWDENNTNIKHIFTDSYGWSSFAGGGHAISNYMEPEYAPEYLQTYLDKYYENPSEYWGWQYLQLMTPIGAHSGSNFAVHFGYLDDSGYSMCSDLPSFEFTDGPHIIDHMYVTNTNYMLNQTVYGVSREDDDTGDQFGGNYNGISEDSWLKIVAYGFESIDDEEPTTEVEFYLLKDKTIVLDWQKWDLTELGMVEKVKFNFLYSEDMGGLYGFTIPAYFAYDDVAVRFEK